MADADACPPINGNADLYGLGIRVGVYLQWFSSWVGMLAEPSSAQDLHEASSVFVFAIITATVLAARASDLDPVEGYVMLQFCFGYFFTTMSIVGVRLQAMTPRRLAALMDAVASVPRRLRESLIAQPFLRPPPTARESLQRAARRQQRGAVAAWLYHAVGFLHVYSLNVPMATISFLKPKVLSWSGVLWRTGIAGMVSAFNIWFWYYGLDWLARDRPPGCVPQAFMFAEIPLSGHYLGLMKAGGILVAIPAFFLVVYLGLISLRLAVFFAVCIYREIIYRTVETIEPGSFEKFQATLKKVEPLMQPLEVFTQVGTFGVVNVVPWVSPEFWATPIAKIPRFTDILKVCAALAGGGVTSEVNQIEIEPAIKVRYVVSRVHGAVPFLIVLRPIHKIVCILWHTGVIMVMIWFVLSIEFTLAWNQVQDIDTIQSTGQLIPFIIGVVSSAQALKKVAISVIKKVRLHSCAMTTSY